MIWVNNFMQEDTFLFCVHDKEREEYNYDMHCLLCKAQVLQE